MKDQHNVRMQECKRCGRCCRAGGAVLHLKDRQLVVSGYLKPKDLVTFRRGELAHDPRTGELVVLESELIKIRGKGKIGECIFQDPKDNGCRIYDNRPLECRLLKCWDTSHLERVLMKDLLTREALIPEGSLLGNLIVQHQRVFDLVCLTPLYSREKHVSFSRTVKEVQIKESEFRSKVMEKFSLEKDDMDFFFGRPVVEVLEPFLKPCSG